MAMVDQKLETQALKIREKSNTICAGMQDFNGG
jgi:hypothetical protein